MTGDLRCDSCQGGIPPELWNQQQGALCPYCGKRSWTRVFPAIQHTVAGQSPEAIGSESESSCFFHPRSRAIVACDSCGRFICGLCDLDTGSTGGHICPTCFTSPKAPGSGTLLDKRRVLYDSILLGLNLGGFFFFFWPSLITAPLSIVLAIWYWRKPRSIVPRYTTFRFVLVIVLGLLQTAIWIALFWSVANSPGRGSRGPAL
ncbi:hypothetical protein F183_A48390 [Bryobacterales bacterium F-183]|nr:hypothetical protein F183_A48390 [Bryobacterales bacterium F-183]